MPLMRERLVAEWAVCRLDLCRTHIASRFFRREMYIGFAGEALNINSVFVDVSRDTLRLCRESHEGTLPPRPFAARLFVVIGDEGVLPCQG